MDRLTEDIKKAIDDNFKSVREFSIQHNIPYTTLKTSLSKGVGGTGVDTVLKICDALGINIAKYSDVNYQNEESPGVNGVSVSEKNLLHKYRKLDAHGKEITNIVIDVEVQRIEELKKLGKSSKVAYMDDYIDEKRTKQIPLYDMPACAGNGIFLDSDNYTLITIEDDDFSRQANFAVKVSGDSMEPRFSTGDILLVKTQPEVEVGELGIFIINGDGFFKKFGGDHLISFNDAYDDIVFKEYDDISCKGKVLGALEEN